jgi:hypothetical protein
MVCDAVRPTGCNMLEVESTCDAGHAENGF